MSGTIKNVADELFETYNLPYIQIPTYRPNIRVDNKIRIFRNVEEKYDALLDEVLVNKHSHRPILISCNSTLESDAVANYLEKKEIKVRKLNAKNLEKEAFIISHAGESDSITVSTAIAGRGTDIKLSNEAKESGGLLVLSTCLFDSSRIDDQLKGRAGRQGDPGESKFFVSLDDLILQNLSSKERNLLKDDFEKGGDGMSNRLRRGFHKAQSIREDEQRKRRQLLSSLDDNLSICRSLFYKERMRVLKNPLSVYNNLKHMAEQYKLTSEYEEHLSNIHLHVCRIFKNASENNVNGYASAIFSENQNLFSINFDIERLINSPAYFVSRFVQQLTLSVLDMFWSAFINRHKLSYGLSEINFLKDYKTSKKECDIYLLKKLFDCCVPVNFIEDKSVQEKKNIIKEVNTINNCSPSQSLINSPCPCGSGKMYLECHGKRWLKLEEYYNIK